MILAYYLLHTTGPSEPIDPPTPQYLGRSGNLILRGGGGQFMTTPVLFVPPGFSDLPTARLLKAAHLHMRIHRDTR